jgi:hypothetical protein
VLSRVLARSEIDQDAGTPTVLPPLFSFIWTAQDWFVSQILSHHVYITSRIINLAVWKLSPRTRLYLFD